MNCNNEKMKPPNVNNYANTQQNSHGMLFRDLNSNLHVICMYNN